MSGLTTLLRVRRTISIVSSSVTRWPSTNAGSWPESLMAREIALPPPCTSTTLMPTALRKARSPEMDSSFSSNSITDPPSFTSTTEPLKS